MAKYIPISKRGDSKQEKYVPSENFDSSKQEKYVPPNKKFTLDSNTSNSFFDFKELKTNELDDKLMDIMATKKEKETSLASKEKMYKLASETFVGLNGKKIKKTKFELEHAQGLNQEIIKLKEDITRYDSRIQDLDNEKNRRINNRNHSNYDSNQRNTTVIKKESLVDKIKTMDRKDINRLNKQKINILNGDEIRAIQKRQEELNKSEIKQIPKSVITKEKPKEKFVEKTQRLDEMTNLDTYLKGLTENQLRKIILENKYSFAIMEKVGKFRLDKQKTSNNKQNK